MILSTRRTLRLTDTIVIDSREKERAIKLIKKYFDDNNIKYISSKLFCGDYQFLSNGYRVVDRKQNLSELCQNVCQDHDRFRRELVLAKENGIQLIILCEHGKDIKSLEDVIFWKNPRSEKRKKIDGKWQTVHTNAMKGDVLYKILTTLQEKYGVLFEFCDKDETGKKIVEILGGINGKFY